MHGPPNRRGGPPAGGNAMDTDVLIVGAGPVGLTLAFDLGRRGIRTTIIEQKAEPAFLPKMERCNARTMEIFRRLGIVEDVRKAGLREDVPMDVFVVLSLDRPPLLRLPYPSVKEAKLDARATNDGTAAVRALPAHLAIHARAAAPALCGKTEERDDALVDGIRVAAAGRGGRHHAGAQQGRLHVRASARATWSDATAARAPVRQRSTSSCAARRDFWACGRRFIAAMNSSTGSPSATGRRAGGTITWPTTRRRS